jgi:hypothetical protein
LKLANHDVVAPPDSAEGDGIRVFAGRRKFRGRFIQRFQQQPGIIFEAERANKFDRLVIMPIFGGIGKLSWPEAVRDFVIGRAARD